MVLCLLAFGLAGKAWADGIVDQPVESVLRSAIATGGRVTFAVDGTIPLGSTLVITNDTILDASGHSVTLSGSNAVRVISVASNVSLTLINLTVANGKSDNGAGLYNDNGVVTLLNCVFSNNFALGTNGFNASLGVPNYTNPPPVGGPGADARGGAIFTKGSLYATKVDFVSNKVMGGSGGNGVPWFYTGHTQDGGAGGLGGNGRGGGLYADSGSFVLSHCRFSSNFATGGTGGNGGDGRIGDEGGSPVGGTAGTGGSGSGGGVFVLHGSSAIESCVFLSNGAIGGKGGFSGSSGKNPNFVVGPLGGAGGRAEGGGLSNLGTVTLAECSISGNAAVSGVGGNGGGGGSGMVASTGLQNPPGAGGPSGIATGGGLYNAGKLSFTRGCFALNSASGATGVSGAIGRFFVAYLPGHGTGSSGGNGGDAYGGGVFNDIAGWVGMTNVTIAANLASGGNGGIGGPDGAGYGSQLDTGAPGGLGGLAAGSGIASFGVMQVRHVTCAANTAELGLGGTNGDIAHGMAASGAFLVGDIFNGSNTLWAASSILGTKGATTNVFGTLQDGGHNISSDPSCPLTDPTSRLADPMLDPLRGQVAGMYYLPLHQGSPAIDAAGTSEGIDLDELGTRRHIGAAADIGAIETLMVLPQLGVTLSPSTLLLPNNGFEGQNSVSTTTISLSVSNLLADPRFTSGTLSCDLPPGLSFPTVQQFTNNSGPIIQTVSSNRISISFNGATNLDWWNTSFPLTLIGGSGQFPLIFTLKNSILPAMNIQAGGMLNLPTPPQIVGQSLLSWDDSGANVTAIIKPNGLSASAWFEYQSAGATVRSTPPIVLQRDRGMELISARVTNISTVPPLWFRVVVSNSVGVINGPEANLDRRTVLTFLTQDSLEAALAQGGYIKLDADAVIPITRPLNILSNATLDASGHSVTLDGKQKTNILNVGPGVSVGLAGLRIINGISDRGAGILASNSAVQLYQCVLSNNVASGETLPTNAAATRSGFGGAIRVQGGTLFAVQTQFLQNRAQGASLSVTPNGEARGGAISAQSAIVSLLKCTARSNKAVGGSSPGIAITGVSASGGNAYGGFLDTDSLAEIQDSLISENRVWGGVSGDSAVGADGGEAGGGGIYTSAALRLFNVRFLTNSATGGYGGIWGLSTDGTYQVRFGDKGGKGGEARGGAVSLQFRGDTTTEPALALENCTAFSNAILSGNGHDGAPGYYYNWLGSRSGGPGGNPGDASGGALSVEGAWLRLVNCTMANNTGSVGVPGLGGYRELGGIQGVVAGCGLFVTNGSAAIFNSFISGAKTNLQLAGPVVDGGNNLTSDPPGTFQSLGSHSSVTVNTKLQYDAAGWPFITSTDPSLFVDNASASFAPRWDQFGNPRPTGAGPDIGAIEFQLNPLVQPTLFSRARGFAFDAYPAVVYSVEGSTNLTSWQSLGTMGLPAGGPIEFTDPDARKFTGRFYRLTFPRYR